MKPNECPDREQLKDYLEGRLAETLQAQFEGHFESCPACEETIRGLVDEDTFGPMVAEALSSEDGSGNCDRDTPFVLALMDEIKQSSLPRRHRVHVRIKEITDRLERTDPAELGRLADYRLITVLGVGSTSVVFKARDTQLDRFVAIKVLCPTLGEHATTRFLAEAKSAASIDHPHVVSIYQVGEVDGLAFIAMKWLPGETLEARLVRHGQLSEPKLRSIAADICQGLETAHANCLIHRDIKPANIWLTETSDDPILLDFGLARVADDDPQMTATGIIAGTPSYMSPEQAKGQELDPRSDLFSLGCLLYRAATGELPFDGPGVLATLQSIQHDQPMAPERVNPDLSPGFCGLIKALLDKDRNHRPNTASEVRKALESPESDWNRESTDGTEKSVKRGSLVSSRHHAGNRLGRLTRLLAIAAGIALIAAAVVYQDDVIRIATNQGMLEIEAPDEDVKIEILDNGDLIRVVDTKTDQNVDIRAGTYRLRLQDTQNAFELSADTLVMTRGGKAIVTVRKVSGDEIGDEIVRAVPPGDLNSPAAVYNGKTFKEWLALVERERSEVIVAEGVKALRLLMGDDIDKQRRAIEVLRPIVREKGNKIVADTNGLPNRFRELFGQVNPQLLVDFIRAELRDGNLQSQGQCEYMLVQLLPERRNSYNAYQGDSAEAISLLQSHRVEILDDIFTILANEEHGSGEIGYSLAEAFLSLTYRRQYRGRRSDGVPIRYENDLPSLVDDEVEYKAILAEFRKASFPEKYYFAKLLCVFDSREDEVVEAVAETLKNKDLSSIVTADAVDLARLFSGRSATLLVPALVDVLERRIDAYGNDQSQHWKKILDALAEYGVAAESAIPLFEALMEKRNDARVSRYIQMAINEIKTAAESSKLEGADDDSPSSDEKSMDWRPVLMPDVASRLQRLASSD